MSEDPQRATWQYKLDRLARDEAIARGEEPDVADAGQEPAPPTTQGSAIGVRGERDPAGHASR